MAVELRLFDDGRTDEKESDRSGKKAEPRQRTELQASSFKLQLGREAREG